MSCASYCLANGESTTQCVGYFRCLLRYGFCNSDTTHFIDKIDLCHKTSWHCLVKLSSRMNNNSSSCILEYWGHNLNMCRILLILVFCILGLSGGCFGFVCSDMIFVCFCLSFFVCVCVCLGWLDFFLSVKLSWHSVLALLLLQYICTKSGPVMEGRAYC